MSKDANNPIKIDYSKHPLFTDYFGLSTIGPLSGVSDKLSQMQLYDRQIQSNLKKINQEVDFFNDNEDCPVCGQILDHGHVQSILKVKYDKIKTIEEGYSKLQTEITNIKLEVAR